MPQNINLFDYISAKEIAAYIMKNPDNQIPYFGETIFPSEKGLGTDIAWLKGSRGLPIAIQPSNYDAKARLREKEGFEKVQTEMAFFREGMRIGEKDRQQLNMLLANPQSQMAMPIIRQIFDEAARLVEGVRVQAEIMRMQLLTTGKVNVVSADKRAAYLKDYGQANLYACASTRDIWGADKANADPVQDINDMLDDMELKRGERPTRLVMNKNTWLNMVRCPKLHGMMFPDDSASRMYVPDSKKQSFIEEATNVKIFVYHKKVANLDNTTGLADSTPVQLIPDGVVCVLPAGTVGKTRFGTTPEESDLMGGNAPQAQVSMVNNATVTTTKEVHPVNVFTIVSAVMMPTFEGIDDCAIFNASKKGSDGVKSPA